MVKLMQMSIGKKLSLISAVGIVLVAVMVAANVYSGMASLAHAETERRQIAIVEQLTIATIDLHQMQIAARDMLLATSSNALEAAFAVAEDRHQDLAASMSSAEALMSVPENISRAKQGQAAAQVYLAQAAQLRDVLAAQLAHSSSPGVDDAALAAERAQIDGEMQTTASAMTPLIEEIVARAEALEREAANQTTALISQGQLIGVAIGAVVILTLVGSAIVGAKSIARPIRTITASMSKLAEGDLALDIPYVGRADEIGAMAAAVQVFKDNGIKVAAMNQDEKDRARLTAERAQMMERFQGRFTEVVDAAVDGDFSRRITERFDDPDIDRVAETFNTMLESVNKGLIEAGQVLSALARADLTSRMKGDYRGAFASLRDDMNAVWQQADGNRQPASRHLRDPAHCDRGNPCRRQRSFRAHHPAGSSH